MPATASLSRSNAGRRGERPATASAPLTAATAEVPPLSSPPTPGGALRCGSLLRPERSERHQSRARTAAPTMGEPSRWPRCRKVRSSRSWLSRASRSTSHILFKRSPLEPTRSRRWRSTLRGSTSVAPCRRRSLTRILFAESCPGREAPADSPPHRACDRRDELRFSGRCSSRARGGPLPFPIVVRGLDGTAPVGVVVAVAGV